MLQKENDLKNYVESSIDPKVKQWWARNAESHGDVTTALKYYEQNGDVFSLVRVNCLTGNICRVYYN
jgi:intraflagellar transport protein 140